MAALIEDGPARQCGCGITLSRFNPTALCVSCQRKELSIQPVAPMAEFRVILPNVGELLRAWRLEHQATQYELASLLGYDQSYVSIIERGKKQIRDIEILARIAGCLGFQPEVLGLAGTVLRYPSGSSAVAA